MLGDAGEDARAAAEVVLRAEGLRASISTDMLADEEVFDVIERPDAPETFPKSKIESNPTGTTAAASPQGKELVGFSVVTNGNLNNNHFYLREVWTAFPEDCIGGGRAWPPQRHAR